MLSSISLIFSIEWYGVLNFSFLISFQGKDSSEIKKILLEQIVPLIKLLLQGDEQTAYNLMLTSFLPLLKELLSDPNPDVRAFAMIRFY
jgi:hypothetical protein